MLHMEDGTTAAYYTYMETMTINFDTMDQYSLIRSKHYITVQHYEYVWVHLKPY